MKKNIKLAATALLVLNTSFSGQSVLAELSPSSVNYYSLALDWQRKGNYNEADKAYSRAIALSPNDGELRGNYAGFLIKNSQINQGLIEYTNAIKLSPRKARLRVLYGQALFKNNKPVEAVDQFKIATELEPNYPFMFFKLGEAEQAAGLYDRSLISLNKALSDDPKNLQILSLIAVGQHKTNQLPQAVRSYQNILSYTPNNEWARLNLARAYDQSGNLSSAEKEYESLLHFSPNRVDILSSLADVKYKQGDLASAINLINRALIVQPQDAELHSIIAAYYDKAGSYDSALKHLQLAYRNEKDEMKKRNHLLSEAQILYKQGRYDDSSVIVESILKQEPNSLELKTQLADIRLWQKRYPESVSLYREALAMNPRLSTNDDVLFNYGAALSGMRDWQNAEIVWTNYMKLKNNSKEAWFNLAAAQDALGKDGQAINSYKQAKLYGYSQSKSLERIASIQQRISDLESAEYTYKQLVNLNPSKAEYKVELANILDQQGRTQESIELLQEFDDNTSPVVQIELAEKIAKSGDHFSASSIFQRILNNDPENQRALIGLADCYSAIGQFSESSILYKKVLDLDSLNFHAQYNYASALANQGLEREAVDEYKRSIDLNGDYADSYYALGAILLDKNIDEARYYWRKYVELAPKGEYINDIFHHFPDLGSVSIEPNVKISRKSPYR